MRPTQLATLLTATINARLPILIVGGPGIGKTSIIEQAAEAAGNDLVISHPAVADPTDAKGFPWAEKGAKRATFLPFGETARVLDSTTPTVWFFDDLGQAPPAVQASYMPWLLARQVNGHKLPDHVTIIAATNRRTDRAGVSGILEPVKSRFAAIIELQADLNEWCAWALQQPTIPPEVVAFLRFQPDLLDAFVPSADLQNCPSPRTWASVGRLLRLNLPTDVEATAIQGAIGEGAAVAFTAFLQMYRALPDIDAILANPDGDELPTRTNVLYAVSTALAARVTERTAPSVVRYAERMVQAGCGEFATLLVRDAVRRHPALQQSPAFVRLSTGELGRLLSGAAS